MASDIVPLPLPVDIDLVALSHGILGIAIGLLVLVAIADFVALAKDR